jgi:hypothetical protein
MRTVCRFLGIEEIKRLNLSELPDDIAIRALDDYFPGTTITRELQSAGPAIL